MIRWLLYAAGPGSSPSGCRGSSGPLPRPTRRSVLWLGAGVLLHDVVLAPIVLLGAAFVVRCIPRVARPVVQGALFVSGALLLVSLPLLTGRGGAPDNPTTNPLLYERNLGLVTAAVWAVAAVLVAIRATGPDRRSGRDSGRPAGRPADALPAALLTTASACA